MHASNLHVEPDDCKQITTIPDSDFQNSTIKQGFLVVRRRIRCKLIFAKLCHCSGPKPGNWSNYETFCYWFRHLDTRFLSKRKTIAERERGCEFLEFYNCAVVAVIQKLILLQVQSRRYCQGWVVKTGLLLRASKSCYPSQHFRKSHRTASKSVRFSR